MASMNTLGVHCSRVDIRPGDRLIVRYRAALTADQKHRLRESIEKWAGVPVEILLVNTLVLDIKHEQQQPG